MERVIVTGGAGYVGSHVCRELAGHGYEPVTVDTLENGHRWAVRWGPLETVDTRDEDGLSRIFAAYRPIAVMHFAGYTQVGESVRRPLTYYRNNIEGITALLSVVQQFGIEPFVFSSTAAVYGVPDKTPIPETHPLKPINPYGVSKYASERILSDLSAAETFRAVSLRYFNAAGASPEGEIGEAHDPETHLIPNAIRAVYDPDFTLDVFGTDFDTHDGTAVRDYVHVCDLASAHVAALTYLLHGGESCAVNLGTGHGTTVQEVVDACARVLGREPRNRRVGRRAGDPPALVAEPGLARTVLNWQPQMSDLSKIIETAGGWYRSASSSPN
ncbi:UDP-glucose 4-epimerase GalE [Rhodovibrio sodomensis]|uniref:UDP-glucose 4-epimerase n=1 Tax=Rhodovibrio sodomensis TaxID=1088 RepID=A0ABS1DES1_9PROT|nr:UDP-glucose 4-epimerase GalE [Rhodovibrio sodomensis]MBK1668964.1 UDP-glucose 4-epimerase GalE [Rhodovibrio sodomensis]